MKIVTPEQRESYLSEGYLHLQGVIPDQTIALGQKVLVEWTEWQISEWREQGLLAESYADAPFDKRLMLAWNAAGKPGYVRSPRRDIATADMFGFMGDTTLINVAEDLLGSTDILVHGVFNARPKLPDQEWTDTPWHQDAQYYTDAEHKHVVSMWIPMLPVNEQNSCLQVAPGMHRGELYEAHDHASGFIGLSADMQENTVGVSVEMAPGDVLCFTQLTPHRALPNRSAGVRWSMDVRYETLEGATEVGLDKGFVARASDPSRVTDCQTWLALWEALPRGTY